MFVLVHKNKPTRPVADKYCGSPQVQHNNLLYSKFLSYWLSTSQTATCTVASYNINIDMIGEQTQVQYHACHSTRSTRTCSFFRNGKNLTLELKRKVLCERQHFRWHSPNAHHNHTIVILMSHDACCPFACTTEQSASNATPPLYMIVQPMSAPYLLA